MTSYYRVMLGKGGKYIKEGFEGNYIGVDLDIQQDLSDSLPENWRDFNKEFRPVWLENNPGKSKIAAGLACGMLWTVSKGISVGDIVLSPDGTGNYLVCEVTGDYQYKAGEHLQHQRPVRWLDKKIARADMSDALQKSSGSIGTVSNITNYSDEIAKLIGSTAAPAIIATDETIEDPLTFAMEMHLEEFLIQNWTHTELGKDYTIYKEEGEFTGQQYPTDTGPIDILAISKDKQTLLVVELKRGRANDVVVGQVLRYMGFAQEELAEEGQSVRGVIIAMEDDQRMRRALTMIPAIEFYRYEVTFKLKKG